jgi:hypothetical protein
MPYIVFLANFPHEPFYYNCILLHRNAFVMQTVQDE